jgi:hypothetical protein
VGGERWIVNNPTISAGLSSFGDHGAPGDTCIPGILNYFGPIRGWRFPTE